MKFDRTSLNQLFQYCMSLCGQRDDAYDLLQDTIEKYLRDDRSRVNNPQAFIKRSARNRFFDIQRRRKKIEFEVIEDMESLGDIERELESIVVDEITMKATWRMLSPVEREVVFLWAVEGMSAAEIAAELDVPRATVLSRLRRMRLRLKRQPEAMGGDA